ncbi:MAG TPA: hypothetical protein DCL44_03925 [Elusimicrobia bacterium]|nr:hypothetical protein [Elusimicrobiota bacterium]
MKKKQLQRSSEIKLNILDKMPVGVLIIGKDKKIRRANAAALKMMGLNSDKGLIGQECHQKVCPALRGQCPILDLGKTVDNSEKILLDSTGCQVPILKTVMLFDLAGEEVLMEMFVDITEHKKVENELKKSEERFQQVADNSQVWIWETDSVGLYTYSNSVVEKVLGFKPEELVGRKYFFDLFAPNIKEAFKKAAFEAFGRKDPIKGFVNPNIHKNGNTVILETNGVPLLDNEGKFLGYRGTDIDITERKRFEAALMQSEKMSAVGQLAAGIAHEINNPLGIILGFAQSVVKRIKEGDPLTLPLKTIEREAVRCKDLVQSLLVFSRSSQNEKLEELDLNAAMEGAMALILSQTRTRNVELIRELRSGLPRINANQIHIQQVLINLANNAIDAMPEGGTLTISTSLSARQPGHVEIRIRDTGTGIPKEIQKKIFDPFFTTKEVGKGTGLGLSLVYEIVSKHGGTVELESEEGKGTEFTVFLPAQSLAASLKVVS